MSGFNKFLQSGGEASGLTDGSTKLNASCITAVNLLPSLPCKTDVSKIIQSTLLDIADTNLLQATLDAKLANPMTANLDAGQFDIFNLKDIKIDTAGGGANVATLEYNGTGSITIDLDNLSSQVDSSSIPSVDNRIAVYDGVSGELIRQSSTLLESSGSLSGVQDITLLEDALFNTKYGFNTLSVVTTGAGNAIFGQDAGRFLTTGIGNVAVGFDAMLQGISGDDNIAIGFEALKDHSGLGSNNIAIGFQSMRDGDGTSTDSNTCVGTESGKSLKNGDLNVLLGQRSGVDMTNAQQNIALGALSANSMTTGSNNISIGIAASGAVTTTSNNIHIGNMGIGGDSGTIKIGTSGTHNSCQIQGIHDVDVTTLSPESVIVNSDGTLGSLVDIQSTGLITGGLITINADPTKFDVSDGNGIIFNNTTLVSTHVFWSGLTAQVHTPVGDDTYVSINLSGLPVLSATLPSNSDTRNNILLGRLFHPGGMANIIVTLPQELPILSESNQIRDFMQSLGELNINGNVCSSNSLLTIAKSAGQVLKFGGNFSVDPLNPHLPTSGAIDTNIGGGLPNLFAYRFQDGSSRIGLVDIVPGEFDDGNGESMPGTVPMNDWSVQRIFTFSIGSIIIQQAQFVYNTKEEAIAAINTEGFVIESGPAEGTLIAFLALKGNTTDLSTADAQFLQAGKFGGSSSAAIGVTGPSSATDNAVCRYDNTSGDLIQNSTVLIDDSGQISTPNDVLINTTDANKTVRYGFNSGLLLTNANANSVCIGENVMPVSSASIIDCIGIGHNALNSNASGSQNIAVGTECLLDLTSGDHNIMLGFETGASITTSSDSIGIGFGALSVSNPTTGRNIGIGTDSLISLLTGSRNICIGVLSGSNYTTSESDNICIGNEGVILDSSTIRIGDSTHDGGVFFPDESALHRSSGRYYLEEFFSHLPQVAPGLSAAHVNTYFELMGVNVADDNASYSAEFAGIQLSTDAAGSGDQCVVTPDDTLGPPISSGWRGINWGTENSTEWECAIRTDSDITAITLWAGLKKSFTPVIATDPDQVYIYFEPGASANWRVIDSISNTDVNTDSTVAVVADTTYLFRISIDSARQARVYIDDVLVRQTSVLTDNIDLLAFVGVQADEAVTKVFHLAYEKISRKLI